MNKTKKFILLFPIILILLIFLPDSTYALNEDWVQVPKSEYGMQYWDKSSLKKISLNEITIKSKFIPKQQEVPVEKNNITYLMRINCQTLEFIDLSTNNLPSESSVWLSSNDDRLIQNTINSSCKYAFS